MRNENDIKHIRVELAGTVQLDLERVEEDPVSEVIQNTSDIKNLNALLQEYIRRYLSREVILADCPATCGPVSLYGLNVTVVDQADRQ